jgi:hypothetical protein
MIVADKGKPEKKVTTLMDTVANILGKKKLLNASYNDIQVHTRINLNIMVE